MNASVRKAILLCLVLGLTACRTPAAPPIGSPIEPLPTVGAIVPDDSDLAARDLAQAVLARRIDLATEALQRIDQLEATKRESDEAPSGLPGYAREAINSMLDDPIAYRKATANLLDEDDLDPALRERLELEVKDDPLRLADARIRDSRVRRFGGIFNAFAAPLGRSAMTGALALVGLVRSLFSVALAEHQREVMDTPERQALLHWRQFLDQHPDSEFAPEIAKRVEHTQARWNRLQRDRALRIAEQAYDRGQARLALVMAERATHYAPEDRGALNLQEKAAEQIHELRDAQRQSLSAREDSPLTTTPAERELALALLTGEGVETIALALQSDESASDLADESEFALALVAAQRGEEEGTWERLEELADEDQRDVNMARHAETLYYSTLLNPFQAFERARRKDRWDQTRWLLFGPMAGGPKKRGLPRPLEWMIGFPSIAQMVLSTPNRMLTFPWMQPWPFGRGPALYSRRYLQRYPEGIHRDEIADWMQDYEERRGNWVGALQAAELNSEADPDDLIELRKRASKQKLMAAKREKRSDVRLQLLRRVIEDDPGTPAAREAQQLTRSELDRATPQRIRISRGFLKDHPHVAGPDGLGLQPELLDEDPRNGELHPSGVALVGGRTIEFAFLDTSGDPKQPPELDYRTVSAERLSRLVALLDETSLRMALLDPDYEHAHDADRDLYFERARLGISNDVDARATARSDYEFEGMREKYGLVRSREPVLPFDIVVRGSIYDLGFGVFPRVRMPKPTEDVILYE